MASYFKDVNDVAEWFYEPYEADGGGACRSYVLERQRALAERAVSKGGFILSHIKGVRCWAGVARIAGNELLKSDGNGWGQVFPHFFRIEPLHVLRTQARCFLVREAVVRSGYDGRGIYTQMHDAGACERIHSGIEAVASMTEAAAEAEANSQPSDFEVFKRAWKDSLSRSTFLRDLAIMQSKGHCAICGTTRQD